MKKVTEDIAVNGKMSVVKSSQKTEKNENRAVETFRGATAGKI